MFVEICVGSSCHLKGSQEIVERMQRAIAARGLENEIILSGCFCAGKCNREGVTVKVNDEVYTGITAEGFGAFFDEKILPLVGKD